jgi:SnoaL-like domain
VNDRLLSVLRRCEDHDAIVRRLGCLAHALDHGDLQAWLDCFTIDGVWEVRGREPRFPRLRLAGHEELRAFFDRRVRPETGSKHMSLVPLVSLNGDEATCRSFQAVIVVPDGQPVLGYAGRHRDRLTREEDGCWRLRERITELESMKPELAQPTTGAPPAE